MPDQPEDPSDWSLEEALWPVEDELGVPRGFFTKGLLSERTPWSFVVLSAAVVEASVNYLIEKIHFGEEAQSLIRRRLSDKVKLLRTEHLLEPEYCEFVTALAEVRNELLHDVRHIPEFSYQKLANSFDNSTAKERLRPLGLSLFTAQTPLEQI